MSLRPLLSALLLAPSFSCAIGASETGEPIDITSATIPEIDEAFQSGRLDSATLTQRYLDRIAAYDKQGPAINTVITLNPNALAEARALDDERRRKGPRSPLHGIPIVLKDNFDTADLPTTAGCLVLKGSLPPDDACLVKRLRDAGAIVLAKVNLSEFASDGGAPTGFSSMGGQTHNPHDLTRVPEGSSGGTGASIAAAFAQFGLGSDTSSSVRAPASANGIVGLRPTLGLLSRDGIVPLSLSFDSAGPLARSVTDVAVALGIMAGPDPADPVTAASAGHADSDYTKFLRRGSLKGARIGIARDFMGHDEGTDRVMEWALITLRQLGATLVDPVHLPSYVQQSRSGVYKTVRTTEVSRQIDAYLATLKPEYPHTVVELIRRARDPALGYRNPWRMASMEKQLNFLSLDDPVYLVAKNQGRAMIRAAMEGLFEKNKLDALIYPTLPQPAMPIDRNPEDPDAHEADSLLNLAPVCGFPDLVVPAGMTQNGLPVTVSFLGLTFTEGKLLSYGYDFEQATHARRLPKSTPRLDP